MIAKRIAAAAATVALILGAWFVRDRVIEDSSDENGHDAGATPPELVCVTELADICRSVAGDLPVKVAQAGDTLDEFAALDRPESLWLTFDPFPAMVNELRTARAAEAISFIATDVASSPISIVARPDSTDELVAACGDPLNLTCVGRQTQLKPTFAATSSGIGIISIAAAVGSFSNNTVDFNDLDLLTWARSFRRSSSQVALSGGTAVQTIQTRSTFSVAIGAEAELAPARRDAFDVLYADPMVRADVTLMVPGDTDAPGGLIQALTEALLANGWDPALPTEPTGLPVPGTILAIRNYWEELR